MKKRKPKRIREEVFRSEQDKLRIEDKFCKRGSRGKNQDVEERFWPRARLQAGSGRGGAEPARFGGLVAAEGPLGAGERGEEKRRP